MYSLSLHKTTVNSKSLKQSLFIFVLLCNAFHASGDLSSVFILCKVQGGGRINVPHGSGNCICSGHWESFGSF